MGRFRAPNPSRALGFIVPHAVLVELIRFARDSGNSTWMASSRIFMLMIVVPRLTMSRYESDMDVRTFKDWILGALRLRPLSGRTAVSSPIFVDFGV